MTTPIINPDEFGNVLDNDVKALVPEDGGVGGVTPNNFSNTLSVPSGHGLARSNEFATQNALIQGRGASGEVIELASADSDPTNSLAIAAETLYQDMEGKLRDAGRGFDEITPDNITGVVTQLIDGQKQINNLRSSPVSTELAVIQRASTIPLRQSVKEAIAFNLGVRNELSRMMDEQGKLDFISDIGGNFIPFRQFQDFFDLRENIREHKELKEVIDGESIQGMIATWQALPTARKEVLIKPLTEAVLAATGINYGFGLKTDKNVLNTVGILLRFLQPEGGERAATSTKVITAIDVLALGATGILYGVTALKSATAGRALTRLNSLDINVRKVMEGVMANAAEYTRKIHHPIKLIADAGDVKEAARLNLTVMSDTTIAKAYNLPADVAYTNAIPMRASTASPGIIEGLSAETAKIINDFVSRTQGFTRSMTVESDLIRIGALNKSDRALVIHNFYNEMELKAEDLLQEGIHLTDVKVIESSINSTGFSYEYTIVNDKMQFVPKDGGADELIKEEYRARRTWRINEQTGNFEETIRGLTDPTSSRIPGQSPAAWALTKPGTKLDFNDAVKQAIQLEDVAVASKERINKLWIDANSTINGLRDIKARTRIEAIELAGDEYVNKGTQLKGRLFTENELTAGINTATGTIRLTNPKEVVAYYKRRVVADAFWAMQNYVTRRELELGGFKSTTAKGHPVLAKPFDTPEAAALSISNKLGFNVWIANEDITTPLSTALIKAMYAKGRILVRLREDWNVTGAGPLARGGEVVEYIFIEANKLKELPEVVTHYKPGYVPKINEGVEFVVKQKFPVSKAGEPGKTRDEALRAFSSRKDAETFIERQVNVFVAKNPGVRAEDVVRMFDIADGSKMNQLQRMENALSGTGGLYTGTRSVDELLMGLDGVPLERLAPTEAFSRYVDHLGNVLSKNEWRIGQEQQWLNTVRKMDATIKVEGFNGTKLPNTPEGKALGKLRDQINTWNRVSSRQESLFEGQAQKLHDWMLDGARGIGLDKQNIKSALWLKHADPFSAMLTANMHLMLGALNPAQLYVQSSAAVVALSLSKIADIPDIMNTMVRMGVMDNIRNETAFGKVLGILKANREILPEDVEIFEAWRRSGLRESVRSNADLNYITNTGVGLTHDFLRKAGNVSLLIYRAGELANRRISFIAAFKRWRAVNPNVTVNDDSLFEILKEANLTMLELNAANKAYWQGGAGTTAPQRVLSLTGQFQQVLAKFMELSLKGEKRGGFSTRRKSRIALGQTLMFGAAGVPPLAILAPAFFDWIGVEPDESMANVVNQGATGALVKEIFGADIDIANRAALGANVFETMKDIVASQDPMWTKMLAVTGSTGQRIGAAGSEISVVLKSQTFARLAELEPLLIHDRSSETDMDVPTMLQTAADITRILGSIPSSTRNMLKARMMHNANRILDRRGRVVIEREGGFDFAEELGQAMGFRLTDETRLRQVQRSNKSIDEELQVAAQVIIRAYHRYVYTHNMNPAYAQSVKNVQQIVQESFDNPELVRRLNDLVQHKIFTDAKTIEERELLKFYERTAAEKLTEGVILDTTLGLNPSNIFNQQAIVQPFSQTLDRSSSETINNKGDN